MGFSKTVDTTFLTVVVVGSIAFGDATNNESTTRQKKKKFGCWRLPVVCCGHGDFKVNYSNYHFIEEVNYRRGQFYYNSKIFIN